LALPTFVGFCGKPLHSAASGDFILLLLCRRRNGSSVSKPLVPLGCNKLVRMTDHKIFTTILHLREI
jgi:hypothetical protein